MTRIVTDPVLPPLLIGLLLLLGLGAIWLSLGRCALRWRARLGLCALRLAALLLLAGLLFLPARPRRRTRHEAPALAVLIDRSASMLDSPNEDPEERRRNLAAFLADTSFRQAARKYRLAWYAFGGSLTELSDPAEEPIAFTAPRTHLHEALNELAERSRGVNLAGVIVLTDGLDQSGVALSPAARAVPLFIPELEQFQRRAETAPRHVDFSIADLEAPKLLVVNWRGEVQLVVRRSESGGRQSCPAVLLEDGQEVRQAVATFEDGQTTRSLSFTVAPTELGRRLYRLELRPEGDPDADNNAREFSIEVTDPRDRLLYLEGTPRYEFKYLKRALLRDQVFQTAAYLQAGPGVFLNFDEDAAAANLGRLPALDAESLLNYRVVVLGELGAETFNAEQQQALADFVDKGGGLLFVGGSKAYGADGWPAAEKLTPLLPFTNGPRAGLRDGRFIPRAGVADHPALSGLPAAGLPLVLSLWGPVEKRPGADALLATEEGDPILLTMRYGEGKVAAVLTDSLWRWQLAAGRTESGKSLHEAFVSQLAHWLAPTRKEVDNDANLQLLLPAGERDVQEPVPVGVVVGPAAGDRPQLTCQVTTPDDRRLDLTLQPGRLGADLGLSQGVEAWRAEFLPHVPGDYRVRVQEAGTGETVEDRLLVIEPQLEKTGRPLDREFLQALANDSGGAFLPPERADELLAAVPWDPVELTTTDEQPLWNRAWLLVVLLLLFCGEWYLRNRLDLV